MLPPSSINRCAPIRRFKPLFLGIVAWLGIGLAAISAAAQDEKTPSPDEGRSTQAMPVPKFTTMLLVEGIVRYGAITVAELDPDGDEVLAPDTASAGLFAAQATLGLMPGGSNFMLAGRFRGGTYLRSGKVIADMSVQMLFGANFLKSSNGRNFSYAMGGVGIEYMPADNQDLLTLHLGGGSVIRGLNFGGGVDIGANDEFAVVMFGMHLGWGRLYY